MPLSIMAKQSKHLNLSHYNMINIYMSRVFSKKCTMDSKEYTNKKAAIELYKNAFFNAKDNNYHINENTNMIEWYLNYDIYKMMAVGYYAVNCFDCKDLYDAPMTIDNAFTSELDYYTMFEYIKDYFTHTHCDKYEKLFKIDICKEKQNILYAYGIYFNNKLDKLIKFPVNICVCKCEDKKIYYKWGIHCVDKHHPCDPEHPHDPYYSMHKHKHTHNKPLQHHPSLHEFYHNSHHHNSHHHKQFRRHNTIFGYHHNSKHNHKIHDYCPHYKHCNLHKHYHDKDTPHHRHYLLQNHCCYHKKSKHQHMFVSQYNNKFYNHSSSYHKYHNNYHDITVRHTHTHSHHDTTHNHTHIHYGFPKRAHEGAFSMFPLHHRKQKVKYVTQSGRVVIKYT